MGKTGLALTKRGAQGTPVPRTWASRPGDQIVTPRWGEEQIVEISGEGERAEAVIAFPRHGKKKFLLQMTPLKRA